MVTKNPDAWKAYVFICVAIMAVAWGLAAWAVYG